MKGFNRERSMESIAVMFEDFKGRIANDRWDNTAREGGRIRSETIMYL